MPAGRPVALALKFILATMVRPGQSVGALVQELVGYRTDDPQYHIPKNRVKKRRDVIVPLNDLATSILGEAVSDDGQGAVFPSWSLRSRASDELSPDVIEIPARRLTPLTRDALAAALNGRPAKDKLRARKGIREHLGMQHFTPHDLRRTAATIARRAGAKREDVRALLDHLEGDVTATYDKYDMLPEKRAVANILAAELGRIIGAKPGLVENEIICDRGDGASDDQQVRVAS